MISLLRVAKDLSAQVLRWEARAMAPKRGESFEKRGQGRQGRGGQNPVLDPILVGIGEFTTHFRTCFSGWIG